MKTLAPPHPLIHPEWIIQQSGGAPAHPSEWFDLAEAHGANCLFDNAFYHQTYGAKIPSGRTVLDDFCRQSTTEPRNPNELFSVGHWLTIHANSSTEEPLPALFQTLARESRFAFEEEQRKRRGEIIISDDICAPPPHAGQEIALFVHYDAQNLVQDCVLNYLDALRHQGVAIVFLTNSQILAPAARLALRDRVWRIVCTDNRAYDWGLYKLGVDLLGDHFPDSPLILTNDSVVGTMAPLDRLFEAARSGWNDITGAIDSGEFEWHLQSFFLYCNQRAVRSSAWKEFWNKFRSYQEKWLVILNYELGFCRFFRQRGLRTGAAWTYTSLYRIPPPLPTSSLRQAWLESKSTLNPTLIFWDLLLADGFPFFKRSIFRLEDKNTELQLFPNLANFLRPISHPTAATERSLSKAILADSNKKSRLVHQPSCERMRDWEGPVGPDFETISKQTKKSLLQLEKQFLRTCSLWLEALQSSSKEPEQKMGPEHIQLRKAQRDLTCSSSLDPAFRLQRAGKLSADIIQLVETTAKSKRGQSPADADTVKLLKAQQKDRQQLATLLIDQWAELAASPRFGQPHRLETFHAKLDSPKYPEVGGNSVPILGWAFDGAGQPMKDIAVHLDGELVGHAKLSKSRSNIQCQSGGIGGSDLIGFEFYLPTNQLARGQQFKLTLDFLSREGASESLTFSGRWVGSGYAEWKQLEQSRHDRLPTLSADLEAPVAGSAEPLVSFITPVVSAAEMAALPLTLASLTALGSRNFEWIIPTSAELQDPLRAALDSVKPFDLPWRILPTGGTAPGTELSPEREDSDRIIASHPPDRTSHAALLSAAAKAAAGQFCAELPAGGQIASHTLAVFRDALRLHPDAEFFYTDEDRIDSRGHPTRPILKPAWSPALLAFTNYIGGLCFLRTTCLAREGYWNPVAGNQANWDLFLRLGERCPPESIVHLPQVLLTTGEPQSADEASPESQDSGFTPPALNLLANRSNENLELIQIPDTPHWRLRRKIISSPSVAIIIPTRDHQQTLETAVISIQKRSTYQNYRIYIVDNGSQEAQTLDYLRRLEADPQIEVLRYPLEFNYSAINNFAAQAATEDHLLLLNNDTEVWSPDWIQALLEHSQCPTVGAVGARLLYPNRTVQHAGVFTGIFGIAGHGHRHLPHDSDGFQGRAKQPQNVSAVTAACLMTRRELYRQLGGLDELRFAVGFNDLDYCLRVRATGKQVVYTPWAELIHHESLSRGQDVQSTDPAKYARFQREVAAMKARWGHILPHDPFYHPDLAFDREDFSLDFVRLTERSWQPRPGGPGGQPSLDPSSIS